MTKGSYIWIDEILQKLQRPLNPLSPLLHYSSDHLTTIVTGMRNLAGDNVLSGVYLLGALIHSYTNYIS